MNFLANITDLPGTFAATKQAFESKQDQPKGKISDEQKLEIYALGQQATTGDVNTDRPGFYSMAARSQWDAWNTKKGMSKEDAMTAYIKIVKTLI